MAVKEYKQEEVKDEVIHLKPRDRQLNVIPKHGSYESDGDNTGFDSVVDPPKQAKQDSEFVQQSKATTISKPVQHERVNQKDYSFQPIMQEHESINYVRLNDLHGSPLGGRQVFLVTSTKGGVGKTTLTLNLANILKDSTKGRVVIVDLMQPHGNIATRLLIRSLVNVKSWEKYMLQNVHLTDRQILEELVVKDPRKGFYLVPGIHSPEQISPELASYILRHLAQVFDFVVVDAGPEDQEVLAAAMNIANKALMVVDYDLSTIHDSQQYIQYWQKRKLNIDKVNIIVNFDPAKKEKNRISKNSCYKYFSGMQVVGFLPEISGMRGIHNEGKLITEVQPKGNYAKELKKIFSQYISDIRPEKVGLIARLFGRG